jgi:membrane fusion protein, heavy metal efflux system
MKNTTYYLLFTFIISGCLGSCKDQPEKIEEEPTFIEVTTKQFQGDSMQLGEMQSINFESVVKCNGTIIAPANGQAEVNSPVAGMVKRIMCSAGQMVALNSSLIEITGNEIIDLQREFAEASAKHKRLKSEYERSQALYTDKILTEKEWVVAESEYKTSLAIYKSLKLKVEALGFSVSKIENGDFYTSYYIKAPVKGTIQQMNIHPGSFIDPHVSLMQIIDKQSFQLRLSVFGKDISKLKNGQAVRYKSVDESQNKTAKLQTIGIAVNEDSKTIDCLASISDKDKYSAVVNSFVESEIVTGSELVNALPVDAIIKTADGNMVLILEKQTQDTYFFRKEKVLTGRQNNGFVEIKGEMINGKVLTGNAYNIAL